MKTKGFLIVVFLILIILSAFSQSGGYYRTDVRAGRIDTVRIGEQVWMTRNLDVFTFRNGDTIREAAALEDWLEVCRNGIPAWCYPDNDPELGELYGKLYNWFAVSDPRGLAPEGFRIPVADDFRNLLAYAEQGIKQDVDIEDKLVLKEYWNWGTNELGFSAMPAGIRWGWVDTAISLWTPPDTLNRFVNIGVATDFWTSELSVSQDYIKVLSIGSEPDLDVYGMHKWSGLSVRCIKESE